MNFGVKDDGEIVGQQVTDATLREVADATRRIDPHPTTKISKVPVKPGLAAIVLDLEVAEAGPHSFDGRFFLRVGSTTQRMSRGQIALRFLRTAEAVLPWDHRIAPGWTLRGLDRTEILRTVEDAVEARRLTGVLGEKSETVLRRLDLLSDEGVTRAAVILFGRSGPPTHPMGTLRLARFRGVTKDEFRDNRQFTGSAFDLLRQAEQFLDEHVPVSSRFVEGRMRRDDRPLYPPLATREALVNAIVHRNYSIDGGAVSVAIYDDRLEIWSTGLLPAGLTPQKLKGVHESVTRNRLIAGTFYRRGLIEQWGRGTNKILSEAKRAGRTEPEFEEVAGAFVVRFRNADYIAGGLVSEGALAARAQRILELITKHGPLSASQILDRMDEKISTRWLQQELRTLVDAGLVLREGSARTTRYRMGGERS